MDEERANPDDLLTSATVDRASRSHAFAAPTAVGAPVGGERHDHNWDGVPGQAVTNPGRNLVVLNAAGGQGVVTEHSVMVVAGQASLRRIVTLVDQRVSTQPLVECRLAAIELAEPV